ncbi:MAG: nicotinate-nucleotide adenylyltransferase [Xanthomonadales bacterium]|nr:nicotinate-nucleotide adenylyltransferase [Xanthomonadales bacterium]
MKQATVVFGGTFDPVHYGHLRAASEVCEKLAVDDFRLLPAGNPPHRDSTGAEAYHRLAMLELALAPYPDLTVDEREVRRGGPSYMVETLASIRREVGDRPIILCLGQDAANQLSGWHRWRELLDLGHLLVMKRPRSRPRYTGEVAELLRDRRVRRPAMLMEAESGRVCYLGVTQLAISSTDIRQQLAAGLDPRFLLPSTVLAYIRKHGLYRQGSAR